jgi:hypothetical protein
MVPDSPFNINEYIGIQNKNVTLGKKKKEMRPSGNMSVYH